MNKILLIFAHPAPNRSRVTRRFFEMATVMPQVAVRDLYELYPNLSVDVEAEHEAIRRSDALVFLFPIFWYSAPSLLKEWMDTVLTRGFAHGKGGDALAGKKIMLAVSAGGTAEGYSTGGSDGAEMNTYLAPFYQTARYCGMLTADPFVTYGASSLSAEAIEQRVAAFKETLGRFGSADNAA